MAKRVSNAITNLLEENMFFDEKSSRTKHLHFVCANRFELDVRDFGQLM